MGKLQWGKPKIECCKLENGEIPESAEWLEFKPIKEGTTNLNVEEGDKAEAREEGGGMIDTRTNRNNVSLEFEQYIVSGGKKVIEDNDGIITDQYAVRLTPEDSKNNNGFLIPCCSVNCSQTFTAADGGTWKYTFTGLVPPAGNILQEYVPGQNG